MKRLPFFKTVTSTVSHLCFWWAKEEIEALVAENKALKDQLAEMRSQEKRRMLLSPASDKSQKFLIFQNCSGWTHPVSSSIVHSSYRYCDDFAKDLPAISRPQGGFFHNFDFETDLPLSKKIAGRNFPVLLRFVQCPTRYSVFCSGSTLIQSRSILSC